MDSRLRYCIITCFDPDDRQFRGIHDLCTQMDKEPEISHLIWERADRADRLDLSRKREVRWVAVSGHGEDDKPQMSDGGDPPDRILEPGNLVLGRQTRLYLLGCFQGKASIRKRWAEGIGIPLENVFGCGEDTETAVSTLFFLNLAEDRHSNITRWFRRWQEVNAGLRPFFPEMRIIYRRNGGDFLSTLAALGRRIDLAPYADFLEAGRRNPGYLIDLI